MPRRIGQELAVPLVSGNLALWQEHPATGSFDFVNALLTD